MKLIAPLLIVLLFFFNTNLKPSYLENSQTDKYVVTLSKKELDLNTTYFLCDDLFKGKKFTVKGFKIKFSGRPLVASKDVAFGGNLKYILKRQEIGAKVLIYDIESFMLENKKIINKPSPDKVFIEITLTE